MRKIVVYTFSNTLDNYGQVLQYLATQIFFEKLGYEASLLQYEPLKKSFWSRLKKKIKRLIHPCVQKDDDVISQTTPSDRLSEEEIRKAFFAKAKEITKRKEQEHPRFFEEFRKKNFHYTSYHNLLQSPPDADVYCVGSDQSWSWCSDENFLNFGKDNVKRIALAPSFGASIPQSEDAWQSLSDKLGRFDLVTVREHTGVEICQQAGRDDAIVCPDPTMLLQSLDYEKFEEEKLPQKKEYLFLYLLGNPTDIDTEKVYEFAEQENLDVVYVTSQGREDDHPQIPATVPQWLSYIRHAKYIMTNSFHGTAFSIIYHKKFLTFPLMWPFERMNDRIVTLLVNHHLESRLFKGDYTEIQNDIDYGFSDEYLHKMRELIQEKIKNVM